MLNYILVKKYNMQEHQLEALVKLGEFVTLSPAVVLWIYL